MPASKTSTQLRALFNDTDQPAYTPGQMMNLIDELLGYEHVLSETTVDLTTAATTSLLVTPSGHYTEISNIEIEGVTAMSGGTASTLKINDGSSNNLLNGTTGAVFTAGTSTSLIAVGSVVSANASYNPATVNLVTKTRIAPGTTISAVVSGTVLTSGSVKVRLIGRQYRK